MEPTTAIFWLALYFLPTFIAAIRHHRNGWPILIVTLLLGWTVIGWIVGLAWSLSDNVEAKAGGPKWQHYDEGKDPSFIVTTPGKLDEATREKLQEQHNSK